MADLLIKGMEMPKDGDYLFSFASDEYGGNTVCRIERVGGGLIEHYGIVMLPTHGRLVDADATLEAMNTWDKFGFAHTGAFVREPNDDFVPYVHYEDMVRCVQNMHTVLEASEGGEQITEKEKA